MLPIRLSLTLGTCIWVAALQAASQPFATLYGFRGISQGDGAIPGGNLAVDQNGVIYGSTVAGGTVSPGTHCSEEGCGTVFSLTPPARKGGAWTESILWNFGGPGDGSAPAGGVILGKGSSLYGVTSYGGSGSGFGNGTIFSLAPPASSGLPWTETLLWTFGNSSGDGLNPVAGLVADANGVLYGTTSNGGAAGSGTVFSLAPPKSPEGPWTETVLWSFGGSAADGDYPTSLLMAADGVLYGMTSAGGSKGIGTVFSLTPPAAVGAPWRERVLHSFASVKDGYPTGVAIDGATGVLYGSTYGNQRDDGGTVFALKPPASVTVLFRFPRHGATARYGASPAGPLFLGSGGDLYGTAEFGGSGREGTVFKLLPPASPGGVWQATVLHHFVVSHGALPFSGVVRDGRLLGTTGSGGPGGAGTIFALKP